MKRFVLLLIATISLGLLHPEETLAQLADNPPSEAIIPYYATLERGLAEAKRTGKPILFVSAAPHCAGISGMW